MKFSRVEIRNVYNLKKVDLDLTNGEVLLVGPNGSGKSNIIKCIDQLVKCILNSEAADELEDDEIWNQNESKCFIKASATLSKLEEACFSDLRVCYLLIEVCKIVALITTFLRKLALSWWPTGASEQRRSLTKIEYDRWVANVQKEAIFCDLPEETFEAIFKLGSIITLPKGNKFVVAKEISQKAEPDDRCTASLTKKTVEELHTELLKISKQATALGKSRPKDAKADVVMRLDMSGFDHKLRRSCELLDELWLPVTQEEEKTTILSTVKKLFGDLKGVEFTTEEVAEAEAIMFMKMFELKINKRQFKDGKKIQSLENVISRLVARKHWLSKKLWFCCSRKDAEQQETTVTLAENKLEDAVFETMTKSHNLLRWLSKENLQFFAIERWLSPRTILGSLLQRSLCILPQNRRFIREPENTLSLNVEKMERMLKKAMLSPKSQTRKCFAQVRDALKSFCALEINVCEKQPSPRSLDADQTPKNESSWLDSLQVLVTKTSPYSITTTLSDLSGGELEILMVLCAVHLSGADTVLLDEPGHSLHPPQQAQLRRWLETQRPRDQVCLVVTHSSEFISDTFLSCMYHMAFDKGGFTAFRLRFVDSQTHKSISDNSASDTPGDKTNESSSENSALAEGASPGDKTDESSSENSTLAEGASLGDKTDESTSENSALAEGASLGDKTNESSSENSALAEGASPGDKTDESSSENSALAEGASLGDKIDKSADEKSASVKGTSPGDKTNQSTNGYSVSAEGTSSGNKTRQSTGEISGSTKDSTTVSQNSQLTPDSSETVSLTQEIKTLLMQPEMRKMFFATGVYFVEGITDKRVLTAVRHCKMEEANAETKPCDAACDSQSMKVKIMDRWDILSLGGSGNALKAFKAANQLKIPCAVVLDRDAIAGRECGQVQLLTYENWKKSTLGKQLWKQTNLHTPETKMLFKRVDEVFKQLESGEVLQNAQEIFQRYGFWIWEDDLEALFCDDPSVRMKLQEIEAVTGAIGGKLPFTPFAPGSSTERSTRNALEEFDDKVTGPLNKLIRALDEKLSSTREKLAESSTEPAICDFMKFIEETNQKISQKKQVLNKKFVSPRTKQVTSEQQTAEQVAPNSSPSDMTESQKIIFRDHIRRKLHDDGGWMKIPWKELLHVVKACLHKTSPMVDFCKFMQTWQFKEREEQMPQEGEEEDKDDDEDKDEEEEEDKEDAHDHKEKEEERRRQQRRPPRVLALPKGMRLAKKKTKK